MTMTCDPLGAHGLINSGNVISVCGLLPGWVAGYVDNAITLKEHLEECYGFGTLFEMTGGEVQPDMRYTYPEDPDLHPLLHMKLVATGAEFVQWNHGICAMRQSEDAPWFVTRMD